MDRQPLAQASDVRLIVESSRSDQDLGALIAVASARLRQRAPWIDDRLALFATKPADPGALDPVVVASVVAGIVKRFLDNPAGATAITKQETVGPYSVTDTNSFASRSGFEVGSGSIVVTDSDIDALGIAGKLGRNRIGTMRLGSRF